MSEPYFKDCLLAEWEKTWLCKDTRRIVEHTFDRGTTNALGVYRWLSVNHANRLGADIGSLFRAICGELDGARRARERARAIRKLWTTTPLEEGRFRAATEILEAFDGTPD
jgi:hypothetical protein